MLPIIKHRKIYFLGSGTLFCVSVVIFILWGLRIGIDFTGGSLLEAEYLTDRPENQKIIDALAPLNLSNIQIQEVGGMGVMLRFKDIDEETHQKVLEKLIELKQDNKTTQEQDNTEISNSEDQTAQDGILIEKRFESIGPTIGNELKRKSIYSLFVVIAAIILYIAWAFRKVSKPISSWKYGVIAVVALVHDVTITIGLFVLLGKFFQIEVNTPFVAALLTILGYSVNDTIVVFDRIRENLPRRSEEFSEIINISINEVITRSINTSFTTELALLAVFFLGGESIRYFTLALIFGIFIGTYSSIFVASPLLVAWENWRKNNR